MNAILTTTYMEQNTIRILSGALLVCAALYGMMVFSIVFSTVDRQNYERSMQITNSTLGELESAYMSQAKNIDLSFARTQGFVDASQVRFAKKNSGLGVTTSSRNDI